MSWSPLGVAKMREKMELADYELTGIENLKTTEVFIFFLFPVIFCPLGVFSYSSAIDIYLIYH